MKLSTQILQYIRRDKIRSLGRKPNFWPSQSRAKNENGVMGKCLRASFYEKTGVKKTEKSSDQLELMAYMGMMIEDGLIDMMKNMGMWEANNVKFFDEKNNISGEIDVIVRIFNEETALHELWNVECKGCSGYHVNKEVFGYSSGRGANKTYIRGRPKIKHLMQAANYCVATYGKCKGTKLIYFSRDESAMKEFDITVSENGTVSVDGYVDNRFKMSDIYDSFSTLSGFLKDNILPPKDYKYSYTDEQVEALFSNGEISKTQKENHVNGTRPYMDDECSYCMHRTKCISDDNSNNRIDTTTEPCSNNDFFKHGSF